MKNLLLILALLAGASCSTPTEKQSTESTADSTAQRIERGRYLVNIGGCNDCHSPKMMTDKGPVPDPALLLSGHPSAVPVAKSDTSTTNYWLLFHPMGTAARGPWGTSFAANLTPDPTGLGNWSEQQFFNAMRKGWYKGMEGTRMLLPLMPWQNYTEMSDEDLRSIFAYLKSIKPVNNVVPAPLPPM
jgi:cytochrome c553